MGLAPMNQAFHQSARNRIFPDQRLLTRDVELLPYESDALTAFQTKPAAAVLPENEEEIIAAVRLCHEHAVPFVARGSGTSLSGGSLPIADGLIIGLNRLNRIKKLDPQQRIAVVEPASSTCASLRRRSHMVYTTRPTHRASPSAQSAAISPSTAAAPTA